MPFLRRVSPPTGAWQEADYNTGVNLITKVLDFVKLGGRVETRTTSSIVSCGWAGLSRCSTAVPRPCWTHCVAAIARIVDLHAKFGRYTQGW